MTDPSADSDVSNEDVKQEEGLRSADALQEGKEGGDSDATTPGAASDVTDALNNNGGVKALTDRLSCLGMEGSEEPSMDTDEYEDYPMDNARRSYIPRLSNGDGSSSVLPSDFALLSDTEHSDGPIADLRVAEPNRLNFDETDDGNQLLEAEGQAAALLMATEHRLFLKAALNLLTERDQRAPVVGMMDPVVLKAGSIKKASHLMNGVWKVKYVEIRRGMFSYYENVVSKDQTGQDKLLRKNIPLDAAVTKCRAVKLHETALKFTPGGAILELTVRDEKRLWMASTREERQAWIQAIHNAMVGVSVTRGDNPGFEKRNKSDLKTYLKTQSVLRGSKVMPEYVAGLKEILHKSLQVPVKWIAEKQSLSAGAAEGAETSAFREETIEISVDQLWRDLQRDSVSICGKLYRGDGSHGPERILGALTRRIFKVAQGCRATLTESQALTYARDVLLAGNRTRSAGDSYYCINTLCQNPDLVVIVPSATDAEPVQMDVTQEDAELSVHSGFNKSGWIKTRNRLQRSWKKLFFVLSEGTLSIYEGATPRPHGLRGQLSLRDAVITIKKKQFAAEGERVDAFLLFVVFKETTGKDRLLLFESEDRMLSWLYAFECVPKRRLPRTTPRRRPKNNASPSSLVDVLTQAAKATREHARRLGLNDEAVEQQLNMYTRRTATALRVSIRASTEYKICTLDPQGDPTLDTWGTVRAEFFQEFRVTSGPNGRIFRGEEEVHVSVADCIAQEQEVQPPGSPRRLRKRLFRNAGSSLSDTLPEDGP